MDERLMKLDQHLSTLIVAIFSQSNHEVVSADVFAQRLSQEIAAGVRLDNLGRSFAPDQFTITLNPGDAEHLSQSSPQAHSDLSLTLKRALESSEYYLIRDPHITLASDPTLDLKDIRVIAWHSSDPLQFSNQMRDEIIARANQPPPGAFLIIEGKRHFPLDRETIKIGRRLDNHLVLDDPHVSRGHARIEIIDGHYCLTDLNSTAGTRINGRSIKEGYILRPGDIISIAALQLIYGEDPGGPPGDTSEYQPGEESTDPNKITPHDLRTTSRKRTAPYNQETD
jgi:hypothetical protein